MKPKHRKRKVPGPGMILEAEIIPGGVSEVFRVLDATGVSFESLAKGLHISPETLRAWMGTQMYLSRYNRIMTTITRIYRRSNAAI